MREFTEVNTHIELDGGQRRRGSVFFRPILAIPAVVLLSLLTWQDNGDRHYDWSSMERGWTTYGPEHSGWDVQTGAPLLMLPILLLLLFVGTYPTWLLSFVHAVQSFSTRVAVYLLLLRDEYPNINEQTHTYVLYPDIQEGRTLSRGLPLIKWLLAIPHYIVLAIASPILVVVTLLAWLAIIFTGKYPQSLAGFPIWYVAYANRVYGYAFALVTDSYPRITTN